MNALGGMGWNVLKWVGYVEKVGEKRLVKRVYRPTVKDNRDRGRPQRRWRGEMKDLRMGRWLIYFIYNLILF